MSIPKYTDMYYYFLKSLQDGQEKSGKIVKEDIATEMEISDEDRSKMLDSGSQTVFDNRFGWSRTHLKHAGLIVYAKRGVYKITERGLKVLKLQNGPFDNSVLMQFSEFVSFIKGESKSEKETDNDPVTSEDTPSIVIENAIEKINNDLASQLLDMVISLSPIYFERLVLLLLNRMGYGGAIKNSMILTKASNDEGIDGIIREDKLGFSQIYIQAKRWAKDRTVDRTEIQKFMGALIGQNANKGLFITTATFTRGAINYSSNVSAAKIILIDGEKLTKLMIENNLGVSVETAYELKKIDTDFFEED